MRLGRIGWLNGLTLGMGKVANRGTHLVAMAILGGIFLSVAAKGEEPAVIQVEVTNPGLVPAHWKLKLNPDGSGTFDAEGGQMPAEQNNAILVTEVHRPVQLSPEFTAKVFAIARERRFFNFPCESHMKVAFQGTKRLSYSGPEGSGVCEFNYSKDKEIQGLGDSMLAVETTLISGARLEKLLQHDRLGVDKEIESLAQSAHEGNSLELGSIRETLTRIADDEEIIERARRRARLLLTQVRP